MIQPSEVSAAGFTWCMPAQVERVIDGDTIAAAILVMPGIELNDEHIRVQGINAPELGTDKGRAAKSYAEQLLPVGARVILTMTRRDKYGRVLAKIELPDGRDFGAIMIDRNYAVPD